MEYLDDARWVRIATNIVAAESDRLGMMKSTAMDFGYSKTHREKGIDGRPVAVAPVVANGCGPRCG